MSELLINNLDTILLYAVIYVLGFALVLALLGKDSAFIERQFIMAFSGSRRVGGSIYVLSVVLYPFSFIVLIIYLARLLKL